jgi:hypothetical protein
MTETISLWSRCPHCGAALSEAPRALGREGPTCADCNRVANSPGEPYFGTIGTVEYGFDDVTAADRAEASDLLIGAGIRYRWEDGYRLLVGPESEERVDELFGQPVEDETVEDEGGEDDGGEDEGGEDDEDGDLADGEDEPAEWVADEEAVQALSRLFDAADRLRHHPTDDDAGAELADAAGVVLIAPVPFAMNRIVWATAGMLARQLLELVESQADSEDIEAGADALRAVLRDHV